MFSNGLFRGGHHQKLNVYIQCHQGVKSRVSDVNFHKFSHVATFYAHYGKNINVMSEYTVMCLK